VGATRSHNRPGRFLPSLCCSDSDLAPGVSFARKQAGLRGRCVDRELSPRVLNDWLGERLLVKYITGPDADPEGADRTVTGRPEARTELLYLEEIGAYGIVVKKVTEGRPEFISWGALLAILDIGSTKPDEVV
jgi:hypothetical protein